MEWVVSKKVTRSNPIRDAAKQACRGGMCKPFSVLFFYRSFFNFQLVVRRYHQVVSLTYYHV